MLPCQFLFDKAVQNAHVQREYQRCKTSHGTFLRQWADEPAARKTSWITITNLEKLHTHKKVFLLVCFLQTKQRNQNKQSEKTSTQPDDDFNKTLNKTCKFYKTFVKVSEFNVSRYWITDYHQHIISSFCQSCCEHSSIPKYCCYALHVTSQGVTLMSTD